MLDYTHCMLVKLYILRISFLNIHFLCRYNIFFENYAQTLLIFFLKTVLHSLFCCFWLETYLKNLLQKAFLKKNIVFFFNLFYEKLFFNVKNPNCDILNNHLCITLGLLYTTKDKFEKCSKFSICSNKSCSKWNVANI